MTAAAVPSNEAASHPLADNTVMYNKVLRGLSQSQKSLPAKYFYDARGAELFEQICELAEYYPTRTELSILQDYAAEMASELGENCLVIEPGSGAGVKVRLLLNKMVDPAGFAPIDVAADQLEQVAENIHIDLAKLPVYPTVGDFSQLEKLVDLPDGSRAVFFPGSTIGNFAPADAEALLQRFTRWTGPNGKLLIGVDLVKPIEILEAAYNDDAGVTAAFNLNMLRHINRELGTDFDLSAFEHRASWQPEHSAIRMELVSSKPQSVLLGDESIDIAEGEAIHTEYSHKYAVKDFEALLSRAGWPPKRCWQDDQQRFAVFLAERD